MRIFKNRGDIYFSKSNKEKSKEQKILIIALVFILIFTVLFVGIVSYQNEFSLKKFFAPNGEINVEETQNEEQTADLPLVSGKTNYAVLVKNKSNLLFTVLVQSDMDNKAFKVCTLKSSTKLDGQTVQSIFSSAQEVGVINAIKTNFGIDVDHYMSFENTVYEDFYDSLGNVHFPLSGEIRYRQNTIEPSYSLKLSAGEQSLEGKHFVNLIRYFLEAENNTSQANELFLNALMQQLNNKNLADGDDLFRKFSANAITDITIRDYSLSADKLTVIASDQQPMSVYNAQAEYDGDVITQDSLKSIKGYFVK